MKQINSPARPLRREYVSFDQLYDEISHDWQDKAAKLQARRWRLLNQNPNISHKKENELTRLRLIPR